MQPAEPRFRRHDKTFADEVKGEASLNARGVGRDVAGTVGGNVSNAGGGVITLTGEGSPSSAVA